MLNNKEFIIPKKYYVYIYLDIRKEGQYKYGDLILNYEPFYVGKGKNRRGVMHIYDAIRGIDFNNKYMKNKIRKIINETGDMPQVIIYAENLTDEQARIEEAKLIKLIGRKDLKQGTLLNLTDGGEGHSGRKHTDEFKKKMSERVKGENHPLHKQGGHNKNTKQFMKENWVGENNHHYGKKQSEYQKGKVKEANSKRYKIIYPNGKEEIILGLKDFCINNSLNYSFMCKIANTTIFVSTVIACSIGASSFLPFKFNTITLLFSSSSPIEA